MKRRKITEELSISKKVDLIEYSKENTIRNVATKFNVSLGTVVNIKRKDEYLKLYEQNLHEERKRKQRQWEYDENNNIKLQRFIKAKFNNIPISGPHIQEASLEFAKKKNMENFKASNGWLEKFIKSHNVSFKALSGESCSANFNEATIFKDYISKIFKNYSPRDIFNVDETALYYNAMPDKSWVEKQKENRGT